MICKECYLNIVKIVVCFPFNIVKSYPSKIYLFSLEHNGNTESKFMRCFPTTTFYKIQALEKCWSSSHEGKGA